MVTALIISPVTAQVIPVCLIPAKKLIEASKAPGRRITAVPAGRKIAGRRRNKVPHQGKGIAFFPCKAEQGDEDVGKLLIILAVVACALTELVEVDHADKIILFVPVPDIVRQAFLQAGQGDLILGI